jgi:hypothetical protein
VKTELGDAGLAWWTSNRNALAVAYGVYSQFSAGVWVFDALTDKLVKPPPAPEDLEREDHAVWSRNGRYLIYQRREITDGDEVSFDGPRQVMRLDMQNGEITVLAGEEGYDFHLCAGNQDACTWYGGVWQQVRRIPFTPRALPFNDSLAQACYLDGLECEAETQLFALNVETGEMIPWDQAGLIEPQPTAEVSPTPVEDAPNFQVGPVYMHPSGFYAFYPGVDGRSLWMVPVEGAPVLWVQDGDNFIYIP